MLAAKQSSKISQLFKVMGDPFRVRLLLALAEQEACVCHLERLLGRRQAYISQHLMSLREAGVLTARREGKYVFYKFKDHDLLGLIQRAAEITGFAGIKAKGKSLKANLARCECPSCGGSKLVSVK